MFLRPCTRGLALAAILLAGCGGGGDDAPTAVLPAAQTDPPGPSPAPGPTAAPAPTLATTASIDAVVDDAFPSTGPVARGARTNDRTPTLRGTLSAALTPSESLHVLRDGVDVGTARVEGTSWSFDDRDAPAGAVAYAVRVVDASGRTGPDAAPYAVEIADARYRVVDLGAAGLRYGSADGINAAGQVLVGGGADRPGRTWALWQDGATLHAGSGSATALGEAGWVVGQTDVDRDRPTPTARAFVWRPGAPAEQPLGDPDGWGIAFGVETRLGWILGESRTPDGPRATRWTIDGTAAPLAPPPSDWRASRAVAANSAGRIVGTVFDGPAGRDEQAATWLPGAPRPVLLGALPGDARSAATAVNDRDEIVGNSGSRAFAWRPASGMVELPPPPGATSCAAHAVDAQGTVYGMCSMRAVVWLDGRPVELAPMIDPADPLAAAALVSVIGADAAGRIAGTAVLPATEPDGVPVERAVLLVPR